MQLSAFFLILFFCCLRFVGGLMPFLIVSQLPGVIVLSTVSVVSGVFAASFILSNAPSILFFELWQLVLFCFIELIIGFCIGLPFVLVLQLWSVLCTAVEVGRGAQFSQQQFPFLESPVCPIEAFGTMCSLLIFFSCGGIFYLLNAIFSSFLFIPVFQYQAVLQRLFESHTLNALLEFSKNILNLGLSISSIVLIALFVFDLLSVMFGRMMGRVTLLTECLNARMLIGLGCFILVLTFSGNEIFFLTLELMKSGMNIYGKL